MPGLDLEYRFFMTECSLMSYHNNNNISQFLENPFGTLIIKPRRCTDISNLFLDRFSVHHQESSTVHTAVGICHTGYAVSLLTSSQHNLYDIYLLLCVEC